MGTGVFGYTSDTSSSSYAVYAAGNFGYSGYLIYTGTGFIGSPSPNGGTLKKLLQLQPKLYNSGSGIYNNNFSSGSDYAISVDELANVFPELVVNVDQPQKDEVTGKAKTISTVRGVKITELIPILIESIKEQQQMIDDQQEKIDDLTKKVELLITK